LAIRSIVRSNMMRSAASVSRFAAAGSLPNARADAAEMHPALTRGECLLGRRRLTVRLARDLLDVGQADGDARAKGALQWSVQLSAQAGKLAH
jgi:hypothetical protein